MITLCLSLVHRARVSAFATVLVVAAMFVSFSTFAGNADSGKALFLGNCASCHNPSMLAKSTGPALYGVEGRWNGDRKKITAWIHNSAAFLATGDAYANGLYNEFAKSNMTAFPNLTDANIDDILTYIEAKGSGKYGGGAGAPQAAAGGGAAKAAVEETPVYTQVLYGLGALVLLSLCVILARVVNGLSAVVEEKRTGVAVERKTWAQLIFTKPVLALMLFGTVIFGSYTTVISATSLGRQQNYAPDQPIKFSHKLHAGINKIECQYCHDAARRSKHASIPGSSTCMNCHKAIRNANHEGAKYGETEIKKIYEYAGYDPDKQAYVKEGHPIEWVRIHNLPDHVYFNHAQHVTVGKIACQECHGKIQEMEVVHQHAPLSMGWCINCHRKTEVKFKENGYYAAYTAYHDALKNGKKDKVTVEDIGGLECQKCHY